MTTPNPNPHGPLLPKPATPRPPSPDSTTDGNGWQRYLSVLAPSHDRTPDGSDLPARTRPRPPRLDPVSEAWVTSYRTLAAVRPIASGRALAAEVEQEMTGAAA